MDIKTLEETLLKTVRPLTHRAMSRALQRITGDELLINKQKYLLMETVRRLSANDFILFTDELRAECDREEARITQDLEDARKLLLALKMRVLKEGIEP